MELRHLRRFVVLAEELHFARAAERLYIEQSPLSRTIKVLEDELGVMLFHRGSRGTRLTAAGTAFLQDMRRLFTVLEHARENAKAVAAGLQGSAYIAHIRQHNRRSFVCLPCPLPRGNAGNRDTRLRDRAI